MKLPEDIEAFIVLNNNTPVEDFGELSPTEVNHMLYDTFRANSPIQLRDDIDDKYTLMLLCSNRIYIVNA